MKFAFRLCALAAIFGAIISTFSCSRTNFDSQRIDKNNVSPAASPAPSEDTTVVKASRPANAMGGYLTCFYEDATSQVGCDSVQSDTGERYNGQITQLTLTNSDGVLKPLALIQGSSKAQVMALLSREDKATMTMLVATGSNGVSHTDFLFSGTLVPYESYLQQRAGVNPGGIQYTQETVLPCAYPNYQVPYNIAPSSSRDFLFQFERTGTNVHPVAKSSSMYCKNIDPNMTVKIKSVSVMNGIAIYNGFASKAKECGQVSTLQFASDEVKSPVFSIKRTCKKGGENYEAATVTVSLDQVSISLPVQACPVERPTILLEKANILSGFLCLLP